MISYININNSIHIKCILGRTSRFYFYLSYSRVFILWRHLSPLLLPLILLLRWVGEFKFLHPIVPTLLLLPTPLFHFEDSNPITTILGTLLTSPLEIIQFIQNLPSIHRVLLNHHLLSLRLGEVLLALHRAHLVIVDDRLTVCPFLLMNHHHFILVEWVVVSIAALHFLPELIDILNQEWLLLHLIIYIQWLLTLRMKFTIFYS